MPQNVSVENSFLGGLKTEYTGLNFPENACTSAENCVFTIIGDVLRREGINYEDNFVLNNISVSSVAINSYKWNNVGGDGQTQIVVVQIGDILYFFRTSQATAAEPASAQLITGNINITNYLAAGSTNDPSQIECQFADGNGFLFVFHPYCDPFYVQFSASSGSPAVSSGVITIQVRDLIGINPEPGNPAYNFRPTTLTTEHQYNLMNQGWTDNTIWSTTSTTNNLTNSGNTLSFGTSAHPLPKQFTFTVASGLTVSTGTQVSLSWSAPITYLAAGNGSYGTTAKGTATGNVVSYTGTSMVISVVAETDFSLGSGSSGIQSVGTVTTSIGASNLISTITTWFNQIGNYPSNADIWWEFKDTGQITGENGIPTFNPADTIGQVPLSVTQAPQGHFILNEFSQSRAGVSGLTSISSISTLKRPRTGCWFQGRVFYAGVDDAQVQTGDIQYYTWTENIYFSQIVSTAQDFGLCYQTNDPTDDQLNNLLPTDGGVIVIQGSGAIYRLFPIQNGLLVFAANGVWLIRGNSGLGFTADDYSVNKISAVKSISSTSYVDVLGLPFFWNNEGIYRVSPTQGNAPYGFGGFDVEPLTVGTILTFYNDIPFDSKRFARGAYDPVSYTMTWVYRSTEEGSISNRYQFDSALNLNTVNKAFYPYAITSGPHNWVNGIVYLDYPSGSLNPTFKYLASNSNGAFTFAEENDSTTWFDWFSFDNVGVDYTSQFITGYKLHGQGFRKFQPVYVNMYSRNTIPTSYVIQSIWDYASSTSTGRISTRQVVNNPISSITLASGAAWPDTSDFSTIFRRHKLMGHGNAFQMQVTSVSGKPFDIVGWSIPEQINVGS